MLGAFYRDFEEQITAYEADNLDEAVYGHKIIDPGGRDASITIAHTFYGVFHVASLLTRIVPEDDA